MSLKTANVEGVGEVTFQKRRGSRSIRLKVDLNGKIVVSMPWHVSQKTAMDFVLQHSDWLDSQRSQHVQLLHDGQRVGRIHVLRFEKVSGVTKPTVRVTATKVTVKHNESDETNPAVQTIARNGTIRALKKEGETFLPKRLHDLAQANNFNYSSVSVRQLKGRWGSCTNKKAITLNCYLMQLPIEYIDYVIFHELTHTRVLDHSQNFWNEFERHLPNAKNIRKEMRRFQPSVPAERVS